MMNGKFSIDLSQLALSDEERVALEASIEDQVLIELASVDTGAVTGGRLAGGRLVFPNNIFGLIKYLFF